MLQDIFRGTKLTPSDSRLKTNVQDITDGLDKIMQLQPKSYDYHSRPNDQSLSTKILPDGAKPTNKEEPFLKDKNVFIAQEVQKILPNLVIEDGEGYLNLDYNGFIPILVKPII